MTIGKFSSFISLNVLPASWLLGAEQPSAEVLPEITYFKGFFFVNYCKHP